MKKEKGSPEEIQALIKLSQNDLEHAKLDLKEGFYRQAVVSAYYVVLSSSRALLLNEGYLPKSHKGVFRLLSLYIIKNDVLPKTYGAKIGNLFEERLSANYDAQQEFIKKDAEEAIEFASEFSDKALKLIKKEPTKN